eukprot:scaffold877_cov57-Attheya_sp.AAC.6
MVHKQLLLISPKSESRWVRNILGPLFVFRRHRKGLSREVPAGTVVSSQKQRPSQSLRVTKSTVNAHPWPWYHGALSAPSHRCVRDETKQS